MKRWYVVTPEYGVLIPVTDEGQGPMEYGCDAIEIEAETRSDAIALGVREMLRGGKGGHGHGMRYQWCRAVGWSVSVYGREGRASAGDVPCL